MKKFLVYLVAPAVATAGFLIGTIIAITGAIDPDWTWEKLNQSHHLSVTELCIAGIILGLTAIAVGSAATYCIHKGMEDQ